MPAPPSRPQIDRVWQDLQPGFDVAVSAPWMVPDDALQAVGLSGGRLALKLHVYSAAEREASGGWIGQVMKRALGVIDAIFDTLAKVVPGFQAFKEFKDILKVILPD